MALFCLTLHKTVEIPSNNLPKIEPYRGSCSAAFMFASKTALSQLAGLHCPPWKNDCLCCQCQRYLVIATAPFLVLDWMFSTSRILLHTLNSQFHKLCLCLSSTCRSLAFSRFYLHTQLDTLPEKATLGRRLHSTSIPVTVATVTLRSRRSRRTPSQRGGLFGIFSVIPRRC